MNEKTKKNFLWPIIKNMSFSILGAVKTCTLDTSWANKLQSDRFLNPNNMICPTWDGTDNLGREVCQDSFYTKNAGCSSAMDRISVENAVARPYYFTYITLSAPGLRNDIYSEDSQAMDNGYNAALANGNISSVDSAVANANFYATANGSNGSGGYGLWNSNTDGAVLSRCNMGYDVLNSGGCCKPARNACAAQSPYANLAVGGASTESWQNRNRQYAGINQRSNATKRCSGF